MKLEDASRVPSLSLELVTSKNLQPDTAFQMDSKSCYLPLRRMLNFFLWTNASSVEKLLRILVQQGDLELFRELKSLTFVLSTVPLKLRRSLLNEDNQSQVSDNLTIFLTIDHVLMTISHIILESFLSSLSFEELIQDWVISKKIKNLLTFFS